jgi:hypothetical protein
MKRLRSSSSFSAALWLRALDVAADRGIVKLASPDRREETEPFPDDAADRARLERGCPVIEVDVGPGEVIPVDTDSLVYSPADITEDILAVYVFGGPYTAAASYAAVGVEHDVRVRRIDGADGLQVGILGRLHYAEPVCHGLKFTSTAGLADGAKMISLVKKHSDKITPPMENFQSVVFNIYSIGSGLRTCGRRPAIYFDGAYAAASLGLQPLDIAETGNVNACLIGGIHNCLPGDPFYFNSIDGECHGLPQSFPSP